MLVRLLRGFFQRRGRLPSALAEKTTPDVIVQDVEADQRRKLQDTRQRLAAAFTPTRPLANGQQGTSLRVSGQNQVPFIGREVERERIIRALIEDRSHVVIFGERGRGKTSLANHVVTQIETAEFVVARYVCSATSNFDAIMRGLFQEMPAWFARQGSAGSDNVRGVAGAVPLGPLQPSDVSNICSRWPNLRVLLLIDEFDRVEDENTRIAVSDTIKQLSDRALSTLFMIIGVSDSAEALVGRHPSIQRCVARVVLPLLTQAQVEQLVECGAAQAGLEFTSSARTCIAELSRGLPYMAQLLSLRAGQAALSNGRTEILGGDLLRAIEAAAIEADPRILTLYDRATHTERDAAALTVMRAAAAGLQDELGHFKAVPEGCYFRVAGLRVDRAAWLHVVGVGAIGAVRGEGPDLFAFTEAMLPQLVLLRAVLSRQAATKPAAPLDQLHVI